MAILDVQTNLIGQTGLLPKLIFIDTNDTTSNIQVAGYLNSIVNNGTPLNNTDIALVSTSDSPHASLCNVAFSAGDWTLSVIGGGGITGGTSLGTGQAIFAGVSGANLTFNSIAVGAGVTDTFASNTLTLAVDQSSAFSPTWLGAHTFEGTFTVNQSTGNVTITSVLGNVDINAGNGNLNLVAGGWTFNGIENIGAASASEAFIPTDADLRFLMINETTNVISAYAGH